MSALFDSGIGGQMSNPASEGDSKPPPTQGLLSPGIDSLRDKIRSTASHQKAPGGTLVEVDK